MLNNELIEFDWDEGNLKHVIHDHPERGNTREEVESLFYDRYRQLQFDRDDPKTGEARFYILAIGNEGIVKYVVFVTRNRKIRPITCHRAKKNQRQIYYDLVAQARQKENG